MKPALTVTVEGEHRRDAGEGGLTRGHAGDALAHADGSGQLLAVVAAQGRLVIDEIDVRRPAGHEKIDDTLGPRRVMQRPQNAGARRRLVGAANVAVEQRRQGGDAEAGRGAAEELAAGLQEAFVVLVVHDLTYFNGPFPSSVSSSTLVGDADA